VGKIQVVQRNQNWMPSTEFSRRFDWVKSKNLWESDSWSDKVSGATTINYKNTCIIVQDNSLLKTQKFSSYWLHYWEFCYRHFHECFGSSITPLRFPEIKLIYRQELEQVQSMYMHKISSVYANGTTV